MLALALAIAASSCGIVDYGVECTANFVFGLRVTVVDSAAGAPPDSASMVARSGSFVDSVGPRRPVQLVANEPPVLVLPSAGERAGTYDVVVHSPGYQDWTRNNIRVTAGRCHVRPVDLLARLHPS